MMEQLNYCRQMTKQILNEIDESGEVTERQQFVLLASQTSMKFLLPDGGRLLEDREFKALDESKTLNLPYKVIALEYFRGKDDPTPGLSKSSKVIVFAHEQDDKYIGVTQVSWFDDAGRWVLAGTVFMPKTGYIDRSKKINGYVGVAFTNPEPPFKRSDFSDEVGALLSFLNILQCSNVSVEKSLPRKGNSKVKAPLKFDTYHLLTIDINKTSCDTDGHGGHHRSPREHLRRGHIRRLADGRKVWVNAAIVGAGKGAGLVKKDYVLRNSV